MSQSLIGLFKELRGLPLMDSYSMVYEGKEYTTKEFINGHPIEGVENCKPFLTDTEDEAIKLAKGCVKRILEEYPQVLVRVFPELDEHNGKYRVYMRLAF
jgi:hypothetical protein